MYDNNHSNFPRPTRLQLAREAEKRAAADAAWRDMQPIEEIFTLVRECAAKLKERAKMLPDNAEYWALVHAGGLEDWLSDATDDIRASVKKAHGVE